MIIWYSNSLIASIVSIIGWAMISAGVVGAIEGDPAALIAVIPGIGLAIYGKIISKNKSFDKWWKEIEEKNLDPVIARDLNAAITIYNKNPDKRTLKKIETLNPNFAEYIRQNATRKK